MARRRVLDPSIWQDEGMADLTPRQQLLYIGLISTADDDGRLKGSAASLRLTLPVIYAETALEDIEADLDAVLDRMTKLARYEVDGKPYLAFLNYRQWQKIDRPTASVLPAPPDDIASWRERSASVRRAFAEDSARARRGLGEGSARARHEGKGREGKLKEENHLSPNGERAPDAGAPDASRPAPLAVVVERVLQGWPAPAEAPAVAPAARKRTAPSDDAHRQLWDAFTDVFGDARTQVERQRRGKACQDLRTAGASPGEVQTAAANWANVMGDATMTELGIVANLGKLLHGPQVNGRGAGVVRQQVQRVTQTATLARPLSMAEARRLRDGEG